MLTVDDVEAGPDSVENQSSNPRCAGRASGRRSVGQCTEHNTRRRLGNLAETREKV